MRGPFFIFGVQRSGTTLVRLILNSHPDIAIPEEGTFWMPLLRVYEQNPDFRFTETRLKRYLRYLTRNEQLKAWKMDLGFFNDITTETVSDIKDLITICYKEYARQHAKRYWGDKTPSFFRKIKTFSMLIRDAKFIHVVRDGRDVFLSMKKKETNRGNIAIGSYEWAKKNEIARRQLSFLPRDKYIEVKFEDLVFLPDKTVSNICEFLEIEFEPSMLEFWKSSKKFIGEHHSKLIFEPITKDAAYRWENVLSDKDNSIFEIYSKKYLTIYDYKIKNWGGLSSKIKLLSYYLFSLGILKRGIQIVYTAINLQTSLLLGIGTTASGARQYKQYRVLMISPQGYTGLSYYDYSLCESLERIGQEIELVTSDRWFLTDLHNSFKINKLFIFAGKNKVIKGLKYILSLMRVAFRIIVSRSRRIHFSIGEIPVLDFWVMLVSRILGKKIIYTPHDLTRFKNIPFSCFFSVLMFKISNRIIVHNEINKAYLCDDIKIPPEKVCVIPHGGYQLFVKDFMPQVRARKQIDLPADEKIVLFFGDIRPGKGLELLFEAFHLIQENKIRVKLIVVGKLSHGLKEKWIKDLVQKYDLDDLVLLRLFFIPDGEVPLYYFSSDLVVLPYTMISESGVLRYAQTCGIPALCSDLEELKTSIEDNVTGYLFKTGDARDLYEKIVRIVDDPSRVEVGEKARKSIVGWDRIAEETKRLYDSLI